MIYPPEGREPVEILQNAIAESSITVVDQFSVPIHNPRKDKMEPVKVMAYCQIKTSFYVVKFQKSLQNP
ncbi:MAG: hypothetical protein C0490_00610 [Marivirga sp.]|nr:hypothetical protein [Marivirga sp.]